MLARLAGYRGGDRLTVAPKIPPINPRDNPGPSSDESNSDGDVILECLSLTKVRVFFEFTV